MHIGRGLTAALLVAGCASGTQSSDGAPDAPSRAIPGGRMGETIMIAGEDHPVGRDFGVPADDLWRAAVDVYAELGIEITLLEEGRRVGNRRLRARRKLADQRLSSLIKCGFDATGRAMADSYIATIELVTTVRPITDLDARLETVLNASAKKPGGTSTDPVRCVSSGRLEELILSAVVRRTG